MNFPLAIRLKIVILFIALKLEELRSQKQKVASIYCKCTKPKAVKAEARLTQKVNFLFLHVFWITRSIKSKH